MSKDNVIPLSRPNAGRGSNGGDNYGERLAKIETTIGFLASREDVEKVRTDIANVRTDIANIGTLIESKETSRLRWLIGLAASLVVAVIVLVVRMLP